MSRQFFRLNYCTAHVTSETVGIVLVNDLHFVEVHTNIGGNIVLAHH